MPLEVFHVSKDRISEFIPWTLAPKTDMLLEMMLVAILRALWRPCCYIWFATPQVTICTENVVISSLAVGILVKGVRLEYPPEYFVQHFWVWLRLLMKRLQRNIAVVYYSRQKSNQYDGVQ
jgi:hypothetical protein